MEISEEVSQIKTSQLNPDYVRQIASDAITQLKKDILQANHAQINRFQSDVNLSVFQLRDSVESKTKNAYEQTKSYIDKAVFQLKELLKKYVKEQTEI